MFCWALTSRICWLFSASLVLGCPEKLKNHRLLSWLCFFARIRTSLFSWHSAQIIHNWCSHAHSCIFSTFSTPQYPNNRWTFQHPLWTKSHNLWRCTLICICYSMLFPHLRKIRIFVECSACGMSCIRLWPTTYDMVKATCYAIGCRCDFIEPLILWILERRKERQRLLLLWLARQSKISADYFRRKIVLFYLLGATHRRKYFSTDLISRLLSASQCRLWV